MQGTDDPAPRVGRVFRSTWELRGVVAVAVVAGVAAAFAGCAPSGVDWANPLLTGLFAGGVVFLGAFAGWRWLLAAATLALLATRSWLGVGGGVLAFGLAGYASTRRRPPRSVRAASAAVTVQVLLRLPGGWPFGTSAAVAALGCGLIAIPALVRCPTHIRRRALQVIGGCAGLALIASALFAVSALFGRSDLENAVTISGKAIDSASAGNTEDALSQFEEARTDFDHGNSLINAWWARPARLVPFVGIQARAVQDLADQGQVLAGTATQTVNGVERNRESAKGGRFDLSRIAAVTPDLARSADELQSTLAVAAEVDSPWLLGPISTRLDRLVAQVAHAEPATRDAALAARLAPLLFGGDKPAVYFVAFVTPTEARGGGGFMGSFAELTVTNGKMEMTRYGRTNELNKARDAALPIVGPVQWTGHFGAIAPSLVWSNITLSPDLPTVAEVIGQLYPQSGGRALDGVITVDPAGLAALLKITGPIQVPGLKQALTARNAEQFLVHDQYTKFGPGNERTDFLADAAEVTFRKLTRADIPRPDKLAAILAPAVADEHIRWTQLDPQTQELPEALATTGTLRSDPGDFVQLVTQNYANNKLDAFLHRSMHYDITVDPTTGAAAGTAHIELDNQGPASGLPKGVIGNERGAPPGTNISQVSLYSVLTTTAARVDGQPVEMQSFGEVGRNAGTVTVSIPPGGHRTVDFDVSGQIDLPGGDYHLTVGHQVMVNPDAVEVSVRSAYSNLPARNDGGPFVVRPGGLALEATLEQRITALAHFGS
jgi:hypothetical protein